MRFCLLCEKWCRNYVICNECDEYLQGSEGKARSAERDGVIVAGYYWTRVNGRACSKLTRKLKNHNFLKGQFQFEKLMTAEVLKWKQIFKYSGEVFLVPAPAKVPLTADHAYQWAKKLETLGLGHIKNVLRRLSEDGEQKKKTKVDRKSKKVFLAESICPESMYIFCDDVVTSGATLHAAKQALGNPKNFLCATIFHRLTLQEIEKQDITRHIWRS